MTILENLGITQDTINSEDYSRVALAVLIMDASRSMKMYSEDIKECIKNLIRDLKDDYITADVVCISIVTFNRTVKELMPFTIVHDIDENMIDNIEFKSKTHTGSAILTALENLSAEKKRLSDLGRHFYKSQVYLITDGNPDFCLSQEEEETEKLAQAYRDIRNFIDTQKEKYDTNKGNFYAVGVGNYVSDKVMYQLSGGNPFVRIDESDLYTLFKLVTDTISDNTNGVNEVTAEDFKQEYEKRKEAENNPIMEPEE